MALTWTLAEISTRIREVAGRPSTSQLSASDLNDKINDYYQNVFPFEVDVDELSSWLTQLLEPTDSGQYSVAATVLSLKDPVEINGTPTKLWLDRERFFKAYPKEKGSAYVISDDGAGLAVGTSSTSAVKNGNEFYYDIDGDSYVEAADTETELSGDTVPQNLYGAWRLEIDEDGAVSIEAASDNGTGYATPGLAVQGIPDESSTAAAMGYVTAMNTASGGFVPGTTSLSAGTVTATFTDGWSSNRQTPEAVLLYGQQIYVRPKSDDWKELKAPYIIKPTALTTGTSPTDVRWGPAIVYGTALAILEDDLEQDDLAAKVRATYQRHISSINAKNITQKTNRRSKPRF
jgi:hypothetical protein